ncbi:VOC family protein [Catellatospora chokoriensis]|uniref:Hydroxylase n=1 Tax=Catellatospora chokoriensis TaxID=310353 RepID=A0A8J3K0L3_9ACTN|nr:VOC family protein [Catellatospora chokoriensis]GIF94521.1 hydroxylase [Catellatospora chokoriensis]
MTLAHAPGAPSWVDLGTTDLAAATAFYSALFGWGVDELGPQAGGYGLLLKDGKQVAGIGPADPVRGTSWAVYFATQDAAGTAAEVEARGGKTVIAPMQVMDQGIMAVFTDPAGAFFSVWQPGAHTGAELMRQPGSVSWVELYTPDVAAAKEFYGAVFGLTAQDSDMGGGETYTLLSIGGNQVGGMFTPPGAADMPSYWMPYFAVEDCDASAAKAVELGATELVRTDYPGGRLAILTDPQGATFGVITGN